MTSPAPIRTPILETGGNAGDVSSNSCANPLDEHIGYKLRRAQLITFQEFLDCFQAIGLRPAEFAVLAVLHQNPGLKQLQVAEMLGIRRANFVALMDAMERLGLAERRVAEADRRAYELYLTDKGAEVAATALQVSSTFERSLQDRLGGRAEATYFMALLDRLIDSTRTPRRSI